MSWAEYESTDSYIDYLLISDHDEEEYLRSIQQRRNTILIRGKIKWAKVLGEPVWGYQNQHKEWSCDVYLDKETLARLNKEGLKDKIKDKGNGPYITFKRKELKQDGEPNKPIRIVDHKGNPWDDTKKIGNDSVVNVNFATNEYGKGQKSANILSLQVWEHVPYSGGEFPTREDDSDTDGGGVDDWSKEVED